MSVYHVALVGTATVAQAIGADSTLVADLTAGFIISDTFTNVATNLDELQALGSSVASITPTDTTPILSITAAQLVADVTTLSRITGSYGIALTGAATAAQATGANNTLIAKLTAGFVILDAATEITSHLDALQALGSSVASIALTDTTPILSITAAQLIADAIALLKISGSYGIVLTGGATAAQATGANSALVAKLTAGFFVSDTSTAIGTNLDGLQALGSSVVSIALTDTTPVLLITAAQLIADATILLKITGSYNISLTGNATAAQAMNANGALVAKLTAGFAVSDTSVQIASHLDGLQTLGSSVASIALTDTTPVLSITAMQLIANATILLKIIGSYGIALTGNASAAQATAANGALVAKLTAGFAVSDTSAQIATNLDGLQAMGSSVASVALTDITPVLLITAAQLIADATTLLKIAGSYNISLTGNATAAQVTGANSALITKVTAGFFVSDTSTDIASSLDALQTRASSIVSIALTDSTPVLSITATQLLADATTLLTHLIHRLGGSDRC